MEARGHMEGSSLIEGPCLKLEDSFLSRGIFYEEERKDGKTLGMIISIMKVIFITRKQNMRRLVPWFEIELQWYWVMTRQMCTSVLNCRRPDFSVRTIEEVQNIDVLHNYSLQRHFNSRFLFDYQAPAYF